MIHKVISTSSGTEYIVDTDKQSCTCPGWRYRRECKHLKAVLGNIHQNIGEDEAIESYIKFIKNDGDVIKFIDMFGDEKLEFVLRTGIALEKKGKLIIL